METLLVRGTSRLPELKAPVVAAIGNFDGVHLGHQKLLERLKSAKAAKQEEFAAASALVISFHPHPAVVLRNQPRLKLIASLRQKLRILADYHVDIVYMLHFTKKLSETSAADFIDQVLISELNVSHLIVGPDAAVGRRREGDVEFIRTHMAAADRELEIVPLLETQGGRVSSGRIRSLIASGDVAQVKDLLGRNYILDSTVIQGSRRGSRISFPTANLRKNEQILPAKGVYATRCIISGVTYSSVTNVGERPTFGGSGIVVETHIPEFSGNDFYGDRIEVEFVGRIREEHKFSDVEKLKAQIKKDLIAAKQILAAN